MYHVHDFKVVGMGVMDSKGCKMHWCIASRQTDDLIICGLAGCGRDGVLPTSAAATTVALSV
jgi:hypothetical protein